MELSFHEKYVLLTINDEKGNVVYGYAKTLGFAGAILMELSNLELIELVDKKVILKKDYSTDPILHEALQLIANKKKPPKVQSALQLISSKMHKKFDVVIEDLIGKGILAMEEKKVLWVFNVKHYPTQNAEPENQIKSALRGIVLYGNHPELENLQLLSMIDSVDLYKEVFTKEEMKKAKKKTKELIKGNAIGSDVQQIIQQEIMVAVMISITAATAASTASH